MGGLAQSRRWTVLDSNESAERELSGALGIPPLVARVLAARGHVDPLEAREFLEASLEASWNDPLVIPGMGEVADRLCRALDARETIAVFGDFDVDGMTSTCLLTLALRRLGADAHPFIPHRFGEGYGLSREALDRVARSCDPSLVVTVDNGIAAANEVGWLLERGIDVVVTDHHEPADLVPTGIPVTDPKLLPDCPSRELAGAGVALKLVCELGRRRGVPDLWRSYTDVAALGTLSDMMLLTSENRALVADGVERMRRSTRPGLAALAATAGCDLTSVKPDDLPFSLIPRLNAAGRMGSTDVALELLLTEDPVEAATLAGRLEAVNTERREVESALAEAALEEAARTYDGGRVIVVGGEGWHEGVKGIVASRLVNRYHVPAIVFSIKDGVARGSGRSVGSVDLFHAVEQCSDLLIRFGGHAGAVGVTCEASRLDELRGRLSDVLGVLPDDQFEDVGEVAAIVSLGELTVETIDALERLQPFGQQGRIDGFRHQAVHDGGHIPAGKSLFHQFDDARLFGGVDMAVRSCGINHGAQHEHGRRVGRRGTRCRSRCGSMYRSRLGNRFRSFPVLAPFLIEIPDHGAGAHQGGILQNALGHHAAEKRAHRPCAEKSAQTAGSGGAQARGRALRLVCKGTESGFKFGRVENIKQRHGQLLLCCRFCIVHT